MCTICGHYVQDGEIVSRDIYDMLLKMAHRGPDTHGIYLDGNVHRADNLAELKDVVSTKSYGKTSRFSIQILWRERTS